MKKIIWLFLALIIYLNANDLEFNGEHAGKIDMASYSYEKKILIVKRIGIEYCIKGNDFSEVQPNVQILGRYNYKIGLGWKGLENQILPELKAYIDDKSRIDYETVFAHYSNGNFSRFYVCLGIYDSPQYNAEVERIMKKYCKECE
ncbi:hypothetical protein [Helicobacter sp. 23-1046]